MATSACALASLHTGGLAGLGGDQKEVAAVEAAPSTSWSAGSDALTAPTTAVAPSTTVAPTTTVPAPATAARVVTPPAPVASTRAKAPAATTAKASVPAPAAAVAAAAVNNTTTTAPVGDQPGWKQVFRDDFTTASLNTKSWNPYNGRPNNEPFTAWSSSQLNLTGGLLTINTQQQNGNWMSGGLSNRGVSQTYGKWEVRFRIDKSDDVSYAILLWPTSENWPPEIDFAEDAGGNRSTTTSTVHYGGNDTMIERSVSADFSQWHTAGVEWLPGKVSYTLDGKPWGDTVTKGVPTEAMSLAMQSHGAACERNPQGCPSVGTPAVTKLQIDWVSVYAPA